MVKKRDQTLRKKVFERDKFTCQKCGLEDLSGNKLEAHHISPIYLSGKDEFDNLITLCFDCHHYTPNKKEEFEEYIKEECNGTLTTLVKSCKKVREQNPELFNPRIS